MNHNRAIYDAVRRIIIDAKAILKKTNKKWKIYEMPIPLDCIDFVKVIKQIT